jgi:excisionase family DNA binding protein
MGNTPNGRRWASTKETAAYLRVTVKTVQMMAVDGRLRQYRLGWRVVRYDLNEIDAAMTGSADDRDRAPEAKTCSRCGALKAPADYGPDRRALDGRRSACRTCESDADAARYQATRDGQSTRSEAPIPPDYQPPVGHRCRECESGDLT